MSGASPTAAPTGSSAPAAASTAAQITRSPGIAERPAMDPEVLAVLVAAVDQAWPRPRIVLEDRTPAAPAWRFSGRWWSRPASTRRDRPWAGG